MKLVLLLALVAAAFAVESTMDCVGGTGRTFNYVLSDGPLSFNDAVAACSASGGNLASIHDDEQNAAVLAAAAGNQVWIGFVDFDADPNDFYWIDGTCTGYTHWAPGEPNDYGSGEDCTEMYGDGNWNDYFCEESRYYVCQYEILSGLTQLWWYRRATDTVGCFSGYNCACFDEQNPPEALTSTYGYTVSGDTTGCDTAGLGDGVPTAEILVLDDGPCNFQWDNFEGAVILTRDSGFSCMFQSMFGTDAYGTIWAYTGSSSITWQQPASFGVDDSYSGDSVVYTNVIDEAGYTEGDYTIVWRPDVMTGYFTGYPDMCGFGVFMITRNTDGRSWCWVHMGPTDKWMTTYGISYDRLAEIMDYAIQHSDCYTMPSAFKAQLLAKAPAPGAKDISAAVKKNEQERAKAAANMVKENDMFKKVRASVKTEAAASTESGFSMTALAVAVPVAAVALVAVAAVVRSRKASAQEYEAVTMEEA